MKKEDIESIINGIKNLTSSINEVNKTLSLLTLQSTINAQLPIVIEAINDLVETKEEILANPTETITEKLRIFDVNKEIVEYQETLEKLLDMTLDIRDITNPYRFKK